MAQPNQIGLSLQLLLIILQEAQGGKHNTNPPLCREQINCPGL